MSSLIKQLVVENKLTKDCIHLVNSAPITPRFYALIKAHKNPVKIRPIVSTINSSTYKLSKFLCPILSNMFPLLDFCIKNNSDFASRISNVSLSNYDLFASLDVESLFTNVDKVKLIDLLHESVKPYRYRNCSQLQKQDIVNILSLIFKDNFFQYNSSFFLQNNGLFMNHVLSPILANIYMNYYVWEADMTKAMTYT